MFFPDKGESGQLAKQVCSICPVRRECLLDALRDVERHGIWGGLTERERSRVRHIWHDDRDAALTLADQLANVAGEPPRCANGHAVTGENARRNGQYPDGRQRYDCVQCGRKRQRRYRMAS
jgi:hypothetical protein